MWHKPKETNISLYLGLTFFLCALICAAVLVDTYGIMQLSELSTISAENKVVFLAWVGLIASLGLSTSLFFKKNKHHHWY